MIRDVTVIWVIFLLLFMLMGQMYSMTQSTEDISQLKIVVSKPTHPEQKLPGIPDDISVKHITRYAITTPSTPSTGNESSVTNFQRFSLATNNDVARVVPADMPDDQREQDLCDERYRKCARYACYCLTGVFLVVITVILTQNLS